MSWAIASPLRRPNAGQTLALVFALLFLFLYGIFYYYLPKRAWSEFAYFPPAAFPFDPIRGFTFEQLVLHLGRLGLLGPALVALGIALAGYVPSLTLDRRRARRFALAAGGLSLLLSGVVMARLLAGGAVFDDELTYRQQAKLLWEGKLGETSVPNWGHEAFTIDTRQGRTGKYLFGEPLVQVPGALVNLPGLLHLPISAIALLLWFRIHRDEESHAVASWATILLALSPMWILTVGTGMSQATSAACVVAAGYGWHLMRRGAAWRGALWMGNAIGFGLAVRMQVLLPVGAVLGLAAARRLTLERRWGAFGGLCASGGTWMLLIGLYNRALSGSWTRLPWFLFWPVERYGFGPVTTEVGSIEHTLATALRNLAVSAVRWNGWWLGLPLSLSVIVLWGVLGLPGRAVRIWLWVGGALVAFNFFYYLPGVSDTGPILYYELLLPGSLIAANTVVEAGRRWPRVTASLVAVHLVLGTGTFVWEQMARLQRLADTIHGPVRAALALVEKPALLLHETAIQEALYTGWVFSFPIRYRSDDDPVVTFPRNGAEVAKALRERYRERHCYYYRAHPRTRQVELHRCEDAEDLLARAYPDELEGLGGLPSSTAHRLGFGRSEPSDGAGGDKPRER